MVTTRPPKTIVKPTALGPVANTDTKLLIYGLFQKGRVLAQDVVNELYYRARMSERSSFEQDLVYATGRVRLAEKIRILREHPDVRFVDFGTRRRFSREWQLYVVGVLAEEIPEQFMGTSATEAAMIHGLVPMGTSAHEMYMVMSGIMHDSEDAIRASHNQMLKDWWDVYGWGLSVALTDTYGSGRSVDTHVRLKLSLARLVGRRLQIHDRARALRLLGFLRFDIRFRLGGHLHGDDPPAQDDCKAHGPWPGRKHRHEVADS